MGFCLACCVSCIFCASCILVIIYWGTWVCSCFARGFCIFSVIWRSCSECVFFLGVFEMFVLFLVIFRYFAFVSGKFFIV